MEFKFSFSTNKSQNTVPPIPEPEKLNGDYFYPYDTNQLDRYSFEALKDMYETLPEVQAPVNYIIDKMANVTFAHYKGDNPLEKSYIYDVMEYPNQYQQESDLIKSFFLNRIVLGAGYINRIKPIGFSKVKQLYVLPTESTEPVLENNSNVDPRQNTIKGYTTNFGHGDISLDVDEVIVQREANLNLDVECVRSRLLSAILTSQSLRYNYEARVKIYRDRGALGVLTPTDGMTGLTKEQADRLRQQYYQENGITGNKAPFLVGSLPMQYTNIGFSVNDLQLNENKLQDFQTICSVLNIDSALFENSSGTYNNKVLAKRNFWEDVGMPQFNAFLETLEKAFELPDNERLVADYSDIPSLQEDYEKKVNANSKAYQDGAITQEEYRESIGYEGGESKYKMQVDQAGNSGGQE